MFNHNYFVYITTNPNRTTYYIGVTNDLPRRLTEHFENSGKPGTFAGKYFCYNLIYFERYPSPNQAIDREKQLKGWSRSKKEALIRKQNPNLKFLNELAFE
ncbi:GIY-YIG nuclease family protein [Adhaeribacter rhizoryzae]|uniref:GIY-YIG nuclease family protein n=1 Tax=Adhaeribacter rhizoryzae TaxID=2607907 RepID=A0A5M6DQI9_9BACT|nr:GIY-YIG nuclease family protein [Adhaeribacter rhizoryzae]KAA5548616.1 GIY-YIG nuclease family protein [Adhaeribacter rhizoryzae]